MDAPAFTKQRAYRTRAQSAPFLLVLPAQTARAQSVPVTTIENAAGDSVFIHYENGAFLAPGAVNVGAIPAEGAGVRRRDRRLFHRDVPVRFPPKARAYA